MGNREGSSPSPDTICFINYARAQRCAKGTLQIMLITRAQWPHTVEDITKSLDGIWGLVGATGTSGNLLRLERSLTEPFTYTFFEFKGSDEREILQKRLYETEKREEAIKDFAKELGFN